MNDVITYWNRGAEELYGWKKNEAIGNVIHELMETIFPVPLKEINETLLSSDRWEGELLHKKRDGTTVVAASRWSLQRDEQGSPVAILETNNDITERQRARRSSAAQRNLSVRSAKTDARGSWGYDPAIRKTTYWSEEMFRIYGLVPQHPIPETEGSLRLVHPEIPTVLAKLWKGPFATKLISRQITGWCFRTER